MLYTSPQAVCRMLRPTATVQLPPRRERVACARRATPDRRAAEARGSASRRPDDVVELDCGRCCDAVERTLRGDHRCAAGTRTGPCQSTPAGVSAWTAFGPTADRDCCAHSQCAEALLRRALFVALHCAGARVQRRHALQAVRVWLRHRSVYKSPLALRCRCLNASRQTSPPRVRLRRADCIPFREQSEATRRDAVEYLPTVCLSANITDSR
jgi:hypothetical protein